MLPVESATRSDSSDHLMPIISTSSAKPTSSLASPNNATAATSSTSTMLSLSITERALFPRTDDSNTLSTLPIGLITLLSIAIFFLIIYYSCIKPTPTDYNDAEPTSSWYHTSRWVRSARDSITRSDAASLAPTNDRARRNKHRGHRHGAHDDHDSHRITKPTKPTNTTNTTTTNSHSKGTATRSPSKKSRLPRSVSIRGSSSSSLSQSDLWSSSSSPSFTPTNTYNSTSAIGSDNVGEESWSNNHRRLSTISEESASARESPKKTNKKKKKQAKKPEQARGEDDDG